MIPRGALEVILFAERKFAGSLVFTDSSITIGSAPDAMVRLDDPSVAAEHAVIHFTGRTAVIEDHGGTSGVFLRMSKIDSHLIQPTDEIRIGRYALRFVVHQQAAPAPEPVVAAAPPAMELELDADDVLGDSPTP